MDRKGVLLIVADLDGRGGLQRRMRDLAREMGRNREITVVTWEGALLPSARMADRHLVVRVPAPLPWKSEHHPVLAALNTACSVTTAATAALWFHRRWSIVHAAGLNPEGVAAATAAHLLRRPYVLEVWLPGPMGNVSRLERSWLAPLLKRVLRRASAYVAQTSEEAEELASAGFPAGQVVIITNGVDLQRFRPAGSDRRREARRRLVGEAAGVFVYCGRFDLRQKRLDLLLEAWGRAALPGWRLVLAGDGPDRPAVERHIGAVHPRPVVIGWQDDIIDVMAAANVFVLPTEFEGMAGAVVEGMACGLPGLVSATAMYRRIKLPGIVLVANEAEAWAKELSRLAADEGRRRVLGEQGRAWVEQHCDLHHLVMAFEALLCGGPRGPRGLLGQRVP